MIDAAVGGSLIGKERDEAYELLEEMASNNYQCRSERVTPKKVAGVHKVDTISVIHAQFVLLTKAFGAYNVSAIHTSNSVYDSDVGGQTSGDSQVGNLFAFGQNEQTNYLNNFQRSNNNLYSNTYNPAWRDHPNLSWGNNNNIRRPNNYQQQQCPPQQEKKSNLEETLIN